MTHRAAFLVPALALVATLLLGGCTGAQQDGGDAATQVQITTVPAQRQSFHDVLNAWGSVEADPQRARTLSLGHGGQILALHVSAGQAVRAGQALLSIAPEPAARNAYAQAESTLALAQGELERTRSLFEQHLATESQLAAARKALSDAQVGLEAQRAAGGGSASEVLRAPADGMVTTLAIGNGDRFAADAPLLTFAPAQALVGALSLAPSEAAFNVQAGQQVRLQGAFAGGVVVGQVRTAGRSIDPQTRLLPVLVELPAQAGLHPGDALMAQIEGAAYSAWAVPRQAVVHDDAGDHLFIVQAGKAHRVPVHVRQPVGVVLGVEANLTAQARIIVEGAYEAEDGMPVQEGKQ